MKNKLGRVKAVDRNHPAFNKNAEPFYRIIMEGLKGEVDGEHFWDAVAKDAVFEFLYNIPGFKNKIKGPLCVFKNKIKLEGPYAHSKIR